MANSTRPHRLIAASFGAVEMSAVLVSVLALWSMGGDPWKQLAAAIVAYVLLPAAVILGMVAGIRAKSGSPWGFARPRQASISVIVAFLVLGFHSLFYEVGLLTRATRTPHEDPFATASVDQLRASLSDPQSDTRVRAAAELTRRHDPAAVALLLLLLEDTSATVRARAIVFLGQLRDKRAVDRIITLLDDPDHGAQLDAVRSLGAIGDHRAVAPLLAVLARPHFGGVVAEALATIGDARAIEPLIGFLENAKREDQRESRRWVLESLERLTGQAIGDDMVGWRRWYEAEGRALTDAGSSDEDTT